MDMSFRDGYVAVQCCVLYLGLSIKAYEGMSDHHRPLHFCSCAELLLAHQASHLAQHVFWDLQFKVACPSFLQCQSGNKEKVHRPGVVLTPSGETKLMFTKM